MGRPLLLTREIEDILTDMIKGRNGTMKKVHAKEAHNCLTSLVKKGNLPPPLPSVSRIHKAIADSTDKLRNTPPAELDEVWTIGSCLKYNIPLTPALLESYRITQPNVLAQPTIRQVRWFTLLFPLLEPKIKAKCPELKPITQLGIVVIIAFQYARREQIAEINNHIPDTSWLDNKYFIEEDFSAAATTEGFMRGIFLPQAVDLIKKQVELDRKAKEGEK